MDVTIADTFNPDGVRRESMWVGIEPAQTADGIALRGPMHVEWAIPAEPCSETPVVLVHGGGGQATDYLTTPDGRPGWAPLLVQQGRTVYVVDRPGHGRSPHHPDLLGPLGPPPTLEFLRGLFCAEGAEPHTQWPGVGGDDDSVLGQLAASAGSMLADWEAMHALEKERMGQLLDEIGPAVVVAHSAGAPAGFLAADARPGLVRALVVLEPIGPPFLKIAPLGINLAWGPCAAPIAYDPPPATAEELALVRVESSAAGPPFLLQADPPRRLTHLADVPIAIVTAGASQAVENDRRFAAFLEQAGCRVQALRLAEHGVHGNGHGMIFERNHAEVLRVVTDWIASVS